MAVGGATCSPQEINQHFLVMMQKPHSIRLRVRCNECHQNGPPLQRPQRRNILSLQKQAKPLSVSMSEALFPQVKISTDAILIRRTPLVQFSTALPSPAPPFIEKAWGRVWGAVAVALFCGLSSGVVVYSHGDHPTHRLPPAQPSSEFRYW
ncbi:unnamed protein product [Victoria cruziana]